MFTHPDRRDRGLRLQLELGLLLLLLGGVAPPSAAQSKFPPPGPDILQSSTLTMIDPEFNVDKKMVTWVDVVTGDIWVASYDYTTGKFIPDNGQGTLIEAGVSTGGAFPGLGFTINGPEWAMGTPTDYVVYTRNNAAGDPTPFNSLIGAAHQTSNGAWIVQSLSTPQRNGPFGSMNRNDTAKITYQDGQGTHYVRTVNDASSEQPLPGLTQTGLTPAARFVENENIVVYQLPFDGVQQSVAYNIDTRELTQLTFDAGDKDQSWMWSAPEANGALALVTIVNKTTITMYTPVVGPDGTTSYQPYASVEAPRRGSWFSLEPISYRGRSYMLAQLTPRRSTYPTSIWLARLDPTRPNLRQLTPNGVSTEARADAEFLPISTGMLITYSKFDTTKCLPSDASTWLCAQGLMGLFRADTGLPPPN